MKELYHILGNIIVCLKTKERIYSSVNVLAKATSKKEALTKAKKRLRENAKRMYDDYSKAEFELSAHTPDIID